MNKILRRIAQTVYLACGVSAGIMLFHGLFGHAIAFMLAGVLALLAKNEVLDD